MNLEQFAAVTRSLARQGTRRGLLRGGLAVLGLGALHAPWGDEAAAAASPSARLVKAQ